MATNNTSSSNPGVENMGDVLDALSSGTVVIATNRTVVMDEDEEMQELRAQEARRVRDEAKMCLRHASFQLGKAAYEIDEYLKEFSTARIPIRRQVILNEAIAHLVANVLPNLGIAEMARVQVQLALRDYVKSAV